MPWKVGTPMDRRLEFCRLVEGGAGSVAALCAAFEISRKTGYKWWKRYCAEGVAGLADRSRRPHTSPRETTPEVVQTVRAVVAQYPGWGGRKLHTILRNAGSPSPPAASTITAIIQREELRPPLVPPSHPVIRFTAERPNDRWQIDFMGPRALRQGEVKPLTIIDDCSRYLLALTPVPDWTRATVQAVLTECFQRYGLPWEILADHGPPWGTAHAPARTRLEVWLMRLDISVSHGRPAHPQTQGKVERVHRTIQQEVFAGTVFRDCDAAAQALATFRRRYNHDRPHEALALATPDRVYQRSPRPFPASLPPIEYAEDVTVRTVTPKGIIKFAGRQIYVGEAFERLPVGLIPTARDGVYRLQFAAHELQLIDLNGDTLRRDDV